MVDPEGSLLFGSLRDEDCSGEGGRLGLGEEVGELKAASSPPLWPALFGAVADEAKAERMDSILSFPNK